MGSGSGREVSYEDHNLSRQKDDLSGGVPGSRGQSDFPGADGATDAQASVHVLRGIEEAVGLQR